MEIFDEDYNKGSSRFKESSKEVVETHKAYQKAISENSPFEPKINELLALAAGCSIKCAYCIRTHSLRARNFGATDKEISHVIHVAASVNQGAVMSYGINAFSD